MTDPKYVYVLEDRRVETNSRARAVAALAAEYRRSGYADADAEHLAESAVQKQDAILAGRE